MLPIRLHTNSHRHDDPIGRTHQLSPRKRCLGELASGVVLRCFCRMLLFDDLDSAQGEIYSQSGRSLDVGTLDAVGRALADLVPTKHRTGWRRHICSRHSSDTRPAIRNQVRSARVEWERVRVRRGRYVRFSTAKHARRHLFEKAKVDHLLRPQRTEI